MSGADDPYHGHPNFHWPGFSYVTPGIAKLTLDADGKPQYDGTGNLNVDSQALFSTWYRDTDYSMKFIDKLTLTNAAGVFTYDNSSFFPLRVKVNEPRIDSRPNRFTRASAYRERMGSYRKVANFHVQICTLGTLLGL